MIFAAKLVVTFCDIFLLIAVAFAYGKVSTKSDAESLLIAMGLIVLNIVAIVVQTAGW